jgi:hypothetical protein
VFVVVDPFVAPAFCLPRLAGEADRLRDFSSTGIPGLLLADTLGFNLRGIPDPLLDPQFYQ